MVPSSEDISEPSCCLPTDSSSDRFNQHVGLMDTSFPRNSSSDGLRDCGYFLDWESGPELADVRLQGERRVDVL